jgi:hypothetical protein
MDLQISASKSYFHLLECQSLLKAGRVSRAFTPIFVFTLTPRNYNSDQLLFQTAPAPCHQLTTTNNYSTTKTNKLFQATYHYRHRTAIMPPKRPRVVKPRPRKSQAALVAEEPQQPKLKLTFKRGESVAASHLPPTAPQTPDETLNAELDDELFETKEQSVENEQGLRRGSRKRTKSYAPDVAFGSEMDSLIDSELMDRPTKKAKMEDDEDVYTPSPPPRMASSAPGKSILKRRSSAKPLTRKVHFAAETNVHIVGSPASSAPRKSTLKRPGNSAKPLTQKVRLATETPPPRDSSSTVQGDDTPPRRCTESVANDVALILNALRSTSKIQVDLPDLTGPDGSKNYTPAVLTELYIQCYENRLWNFCDLVADTWIRALQKANKRSHRKKNKVEYMWRENIALEKIFAEKGKGFKKKAPDYHLDVEDPGMDRDVSATDPERLRDLFAHTNPGCAARLLWADNMALCGQKLEDRITQNPGLWPKDLFYEVMCTSLRLIGRKLTLKIEEKYEGAWCTRYHEHAKHGRKCYRRLAWIQQGRPKTRSRQASVASVASVAVNGDGDHDGLFAEDDVEGDVDASVLVDYEGEDDSGTESEEEG